MVEHNRCNGDGLRLDGKSPPAEIRTRFGTELCLVEVLSHRSCETDESQRRNSKR